MIGSVGLYFMVSCEYVGRYIGRHVGTAIVASKNDTGQSNALVCRIVCLFVCFPKVIVWIYIELLCCRNVLDGCLFVCLLVWRE